MHRERLGHLTGNLTLRRSKSDQEGQTMVRGLPKGSVFRENAAASVGL
jgi:hypothetical protein